MSASLSGPHPGGGGTAGQRYSALLWALLHVPVFLALYASGMAAAIRATPESFRAFVWPTFLPQATLIALVAFVLALPFGLVRRAYRFAAPALAALVTAAVALDSRIYQSVGFHLNGFFLRFLLQPNALREAGVPLSDVLGFLGLAALLLAVDVAIGAWFIRRFAAPRRRAWLLALGLVLLSAAERTYGGVLTYFAGPSVFAASTVLPLQPPVRMYGFSEKVFGKRAMQDPFVGQDASKRLPAGVAPGEVKLARRPDVLFLVVESLPAAHLDEKTMPLFFRRAREGAVFPRHYAGASATNYTLFSLMYGLQAQKLEAIVGAGRQPLLFPVLAAHDYQMKVLAASCVDWMELKGTVFGGVPEQDLKTWCDEQGPRDRDTAMVGDALAFAREAAPDKPVFMFLFFFGTHFNYFVEPQDEVFQPFWDGAGGVKATTTPGPLVEARARNAAHRLDRVLDRFLGDFEQARGRAPLLVFTGDHGEEFRQKGHMAHGSAVTSEQIHVPAVWLGPGVAKGRYDVPTSHADVVPTLLALLGDTHPPALYADGMSMFQAPRDRFVVSTVGWEPHYAAIGYDLKITMYAGLGTAQITDPEDRPLPDGPARLAAAAGRILKALRGDTSDATHAAAGR